MKTEKGQTQKRKPTNKLAEQVAGVGEKGARRAVIEDLFYDFHSSRSRVYVMNFVRGLFFGLGSVIGATILIALIIWFLGFFGDIFPPLADFLNNLIDTMESRE